MTSELSKEAADLVKHGRSALRPTAADKARVLSALKAQLPPAAPTAATGGLGGLNVGGKTLLMAAGAAVAVVAVIVYTTRPPESASLGASSTTPSAQGAEFVAPVADTISPALGATPELRETAAPPAVAPVAAGRGNVSDRLAEEVALLTRAQREFHAGNFNAALASVDEHRRKFARGTLGQERVKLRVKVLCALGRTGDAKVEHRKLGKLSAATGSADDVCGGK